VPKVGPTGSAPGMSSGAMCDIRRPKAKLHDVLLAKSGLGKIDARCAFWLFSTNAICKRDSRHGCGGADVMSDSST
jgi:hypothetical protein